ncbi:hypothetical protein PUNSTDRAFT_80677 [Punctularia strigosozonata HHB-11173 SS5]|uniref:uncharacterized protein n=1 Tax=Punctularia strigosozonata (strain HHB-11173) TaxID=741275 RepID=UPI0004416ACC|nr:uncharacterized protein PUNSTDRAFT_80677 [Punctularia strigosozonata HHB-11173 SS5]EIN14369.1 hypothetical protein PUNSTDRAFT_80677 [Punctularia strigosozonata HHB-11173 SS5]
MPPRPPAAPALPTAVATAYSLALLQEYTHTLDALPLDLSRNFADLRELDAVLSASVHSITSKIERLTTIIEQDHNPDRKDERLWLLAEIAEEASRLKPGGEDKIRVACQAADNLQTHEAHLTTLLENVPSPDFETAVISRNTVYPHVAARQYTMQGNTQEGRRRRAALAGQAYGGQESPAKRKRATPREEDNDAAAYGRAPRKEQRVLEGHAPTRQPRAAARVKKSDRAASPAESLLSIASHIPQARTAAGHASVIGTKREGSNASGTRRGRNSNVGTPITQEAFVVPNPRAEQPPSASTSHPSLPAPLANQSYASAAQGWARGPLEGPGVVRDISLPPPGAEDSAVEGDEEEPDTQLWCVCNRGSFGQMIGCDSKTCQYSWFHLECLQMTKIPEEQTEWICPYCEEKAAKKPRGGARGGKRRGGSGASRAKSTQNQNKAPVAAKP